MEAIRPLLGVGWDRKANEPAWKYIEFPGKRDFVDHRWRTENGGTIAAYEFFPMPANVDLQQTAVKALHRLERLDDIVDIAHNGRRHVRIRAQAVVLAIEAGHYVRVRDVILWCIGQPDWIKGGEWLIENYSAAIPSDDLLVIAQDTGYHPMVRCAAARRLVERGRGEPVAPFLANVAAMRLELPPWEAGRLSVAAIEMLRQAKRRQELVDVAQSPKLPVDILRPLAAALEEVGETETAAGVQQQISQFPVPDRWAEMRAAMNNPFYDAQDLARTGNREAAWQLIEANLDNPTARYSPENMSTSSPPEQVAVLVRRALLGLEAHPEYQIGELDLLARLGYPEEAEGMARQLFDHPDLQPFDRLRLAKDVAQWDKQATAAEMLRELAAAPYDGYIQSQAAKGLAALGLTEAAVAILGRLLDAPSCTPSERHSVIDIALAVGPTDAAQRVALAMLADAQTSVADRVYTLNLLVRRGMPVACPPDLLAQARATVPDEEGPATAILDLLRDYGTPEIDAPILVRRALARLPQRRGDRKRDIRNLNRDYSTRRECAEAAEKLLPVDQAAAVWRLLVTLPTPPIA